MAAEVIMARYTEIKNETQILDRGYNAVRRMAKEMVEAGADTSDILFHANQVWHEFKAAAIAVPGISQTGMYIDQYDAALTTQIISRSPRYKGGIDSARADKLATELKACKELPPVVIRRAKAGK
jgi:hypothetical protein